MPPVVIRTCYDGDQFGEVSHFLPSIKEMNALMGVEEGMKEQLDLQPNEDSIFERKVNVSQNMIKDLEEEEVKRLNQQRTSATTMEPCDLLYINKLHSMVTIGKGM